MDESKVSKQVKKDKIKKETKKSEERQIEDKAKIDELIILKQKTMTSRRIIKS